MVLRSLFTKKVCIGALHECLADGAWTEPSCSLFEVMAGPCSYNGSHCVQSAVGLGAGGAGACRVRVLQPVVAEMVGEFLPQLGRENPGHTLDETRFFLPCI